MKIRSLCITRHISGGFWRSTVFPELTDVKALPFMSVVQSVRGSYGIALGDGAMEETGPMGVFVAPSQVRQTIWHFGDDEGMMDAHWVFFDVEINRLYRLDDLYTFPTVLPARYNEEIFAILSAVRTEKAFLRRLPHLHRLAEILIENATPRTRMREDLVRLRNYVDEHHMHPITPEDLMGVLHCSRSAMYRHFREGFGESPSHYINRIRVQHAQFLLLGTTDSIGSIAAAVGFQDVFYFSRVFREISGMSAREYRERAEV